MSTNQKIVKNFEDYDTFLDSLSVRNKQIALSVKMMYAIHMENNKHKGAFFIGKQVLRGIIKFFSIPFIAGRLVHEDKFSRNIIIANSSIEKMISKELNVSLVSISRYMKFNININIIYKEFFSLLAHYMKDKNLNKIYIILLLHRIIDYLVIYHTISIENIRTILVENDRSSKNLALIHHANHLGISTIKYDNWLIDPVNHNDIYCKYYFYPSLYHKHIIDSFSSNKELIYIKGGFFSWDRLSRYKVKSVQKIIYFTQFGISVSKHKQYINDIIDILKTLDKDYQLIIKIHPREKYEKYRHIIENNYPLKLMTECDDIYQLISEAEFCFSVFSTISLEAKHIIENSYFINYDYQNFEIVDYQEIKLDVVKNKKNLSHILHNNYTPRDKKIFIKENNCSFPYTINTMEKILTHDKE